MGALPKLKGLRIILLISPSSTSIPSICVPEASTEHVGGLIPVRSQTIRAEDSLLKKKYQTISTVNWFDFRLPKIKRTNIFHTDREIGKGRSLEVPTWSGGVGGTELS